MIKILVVEDDPDAMEIITRMLERKGCLVIKSLNGRSALETLQANPDIQMLITDMMMPVMGGEELVRLVRAMKSFEDLPIIMMSAVIGVNDVAHLLDQGVNWFLPKPLSSKSLHELMEQVRDIGGMHE